MRENDYERYRREARAYNRRLMENPSGCLPAGLERKEYERLLNPSSCGVMGQISIPKLHCFLPIYHGIKSEACPVGMEHIPGSSLPVGGPVTHTVLTVKRLVFPMGIPGKTACLGVGDIFWIRVLGETLRYRIDRVDTAAPALPLDFRIDPAMDYCTLLSLDFRGNPGQWILMRGVRRELFPLTAKKRIRWLYHPRVLSMEERRFPADLRALAAETKPNGIIRIHLAGRSGTAF